MVAFLGGATPSLTGAAYNYAKGITEQVAQPRDSASG